MGDKYQIPLNFFTCCKHEMDELEYHAVKQNLKNRFENKGKRLVTENYIKLTSRELSKEFKYFVMSNDDLRNESSRIICQDQVSYFELVLKKCLLKKNLYIEPRLDNTLAFVPPSNMYEENKVKY
jgi:hypothetical protein